MASLYIEFEEGDFGDGDIELCDSGAGASGRGGAGDGPFDYAPSDYGGPTADGSGAADEFAALDPFDPESEELIARIGLASGDEVLGAAPRREAPRWSWARVPERHRKLLVGTVVLAGLGAGVGDALGAEAAQHAADRPTLDLVDASFTGNADGDGFDLMLDLGNGGASTATITAVDVHQPGLSLIYPGAEAAIEPHQQAEIVLSGRYDCSGLTGDPVTVRVTLHTSHGTAADLDFPLPPGARLPDGWLAGRAAFCYGGLPPAGF